MSADQPTLPAKAAMWVLVEHHDGEVQEACLEVLSEAARLAKKARLPLAAVVLGCSGTALAELLSTHGADHVYSVDHQLLRSYTTEAYAAALAELLSRYQPDVFLLAGTALGRDLAARLAVRLGVGLVSNCTVLDLNQQGLLEMTRPTCGGRVYTTILQSSRPQIATVRPGVLGVGKPMRGRRAVLESLEVTLHPETIRTRVVGNSEVDLEQLDIAEAEVVVAYGRGLGDRSMLPHMQELAQRLHASLGGSRAAVDERWIPFERQIGQTGKTIVPKVVVCCGISGAQQFVMGMRDSRFIIAINTDRSAPIFKAADVCVLGDLREIVPELVRQFEPAAESAGPG